MSGAPEDLIVSVAELDRQLKRVIEGTSQGLWVEGEVTCLKRVTSGHVYFTLKDELEDATIDCVMYRFDALRAQRHLSDGARVQLLGRATLWAPRGRLQFVGTRLRPSGRGALLLAQEALKRKLTSEGLFEAGRKRPLPEHPKLVGVVTSRTGAVFHDIRTVAFRRGSVCLLLSAAQVQGEGAAESLIAAIDRLERHPGLEVMIVGRGGGSGDDLMVFNDERVVRRLARVSVPVVSAVGHETDISLCDLVADVRAATPSQAAELVVPDCEARKRSLLQARLSLGRAMQRRMLRARNGVERLQSKLTDPRFLIAERQQDLDELETRLRRRLDRRIARQHQVTSGLLARLLTQHPRAIIAEHAARVGPLAERLRGALKLSLRERRSELARHAGRLDALSPLSVLGRGYAIAFSEEGRVLRRAREAAAGQRVLVRLSEGALETEVRSVRLHRDGAGE